MSKKTSQSPVEVLVEPVFAVQTTRECGTDPEAMSGAMGSAFGQIHQFAGQHGLHFTGPPRAIYHEYSAGKTRFTVAIPIAAPTGDVPGDELVTVDKISGGKALRFTHTGSYRNLENSYDAATQWMRGEGFLESDADLTKYSPTWEEYMNDPESTPEAELLTYIYVPVP